MKRLTAYLLALLLVFSGNASAAGLTLLGAGKKPAAGGAATIAYVDAGTHATGATSVAPTYPTTSAGNMLLLVVWSRGSGDPTPTTPGGWNLLASYNGGAGAYGIDTGNARVTVYWVEATGSESGTVSVTITGGGTARGRIYQFSKSSGAWATPVIDGGADNTSGTAWSVTGGAAYALAVEDFIFAVSCANGDVAFSYSAHALSATSITFGAVTERDDISIGFGEDHQAFAASATVTAGSATNVITYTATGNASGTDTPAGATALVRLRAS